MSFRGSVAPFFSAPNNIPLSRSGLLRRLSQKDIYRLRVLALAKTAAVNSHVRLRVGTKAIRLLQGKKCHEHTRLWIPWEAVLGLGRHAKLSPKAAVPFCMGTQ
jgi:hypothetical protein